jgi:hypothetical protein
MALTRAQYLSGDSGNGAILAGQVQGVRLGTGTGIAIAADGSISVNASTIVGVSKLNNPIAYNGYIWPNSLPIAPALLTTNAAGQLSWTNISGGGVGSVTSVDVSGGTTGLLFSGGPVTTAGTITMSGVLGIANGGTGATTQTGSANAVLPPQAGNTGKYLTTDGANASWGDLAIDAVTQIVAGANITVSPAGGKGIVTINSTGGGGGGGGLTGLQEIDDISAGFNGVTVAFPITIGGAQPIPAGPGTGQLIIALGGILQTPGIAFTFDNATDTLTFTAAPPAGISFSGYVGGDAAPITSIVAGTGLSGGGTSGIVNLSITPTGVLPGTYTSPNVTINAQGQITAASSGGGGVPSGSVLAFYQTTAPTGWTQRLDAGLSDAAIRLVTDGSGGSTAGSIPFSTLFSSSATYSGSINITSGQVGDTVLSEGQLASHAHGYIRSQDSNRRITGNAPSCNTGVFGDNTGGTGGNQSHSHSLAGAAAVGDFSSNFAVKYANFVVCSKD